MKKVGIDGQIFSIQKFGGISRFFSSLLDRSFYQSTDLSIYPLFARHRNFYLSLLDVGCYRPSDNPMSLLAGEMHLDRNNKIATYESPSHVHTTYYIGDHPSLVLSGSSRPLFISSLYDMIPENYPIFFPNGNPHHNKLAWLEKSDIIVSISHSAAADLLDIRPSLADRIRVIHLGTDISFPFDFNAQSKRVDWPYFLFVGIRNGYKNSRLLLRAFARASSSIRRHRLVFAGGGPPSPLENSLINDLGIPDRVVFCQPEDKDLKILYSQAQAVVVPSLAEGFSLPLIEALATDTPVICSDISAHKEVGKGYCHFVPSTNVEDWTSIFVCASSLQRPSELLGQQTHVTKRYYSVPRMIHEYTSLCLAT